MLVVFKPQQASATQHHIDWLKAVAVEHAITLHWYETSGDFTRDKAAIMAKAEHVSQVVAIGGDGTLHLVANALAGNTHCAMAILPAGTGNDFARQFGFNESMWRTAVFSKRQMAIDLGVVNQRYFLNIAGVGFNATVVAGLNMSERRHRFSYVWAGLRQLFRYRSVNLAVAEQPAKPTLMLVIGNGRFFAAGLSPTPEASLQDGQFDCVQFHGNSAWQRVMSFIAMLAGFHRRLKHVRHWRAALVSVGSGGLAIEADGELIGHTPATFRCVKAALQLKMPQ
ncbi:diacylglycerol/lipid kinase family protein [Pseudoalteromonas fenneropenaei]|uniref:Diacylglycerol/lipid kinase family protein n=1 Tax=Pseudoalteromonas fenneropenaei TaxID=1737459 RepID=A0ABV7CPD2_9GAMM